MEQSLIASIRNTMEKKSTAELKRIYHRRSSWRSPEAFVVIYQILMERGETVTPGNSGFKEFSISFKEFSISVVIKDKGFANDISPQGVASKQHFDISITNQSSQTVKWITVEVATLFSEQSTSKVYGSYVSDGNTRYTSSTFYHTRSWGSKHPYSYSEPVPAGEARTYTGAWISFGNQTLDYLQEHFQEIFVYQCYGEFWAGEKFHKIARPEISFDSNGHHHHRTTQSGLCFISTAAFGDSQHPVVKEFRAFRDDVLMRHETGRQFVAWYNRNSPTIANYVAPRPYLRTIVRSVLAPLALVVRTIRSQKTQR